MLPGPFGTPMPVDMGILQEARSFMGHAISTTIDATYEQLRNNASGEVLSVVNDRLPWVPVEIRMAVVGTLSRHLPNCVDVATQFDPFMDPDNQWDSEIEDVPDFVPDGGSGLNPGDIGTVEGNVQSNESYSFQGLMEAELDYGYV